MRKEIEKRIEELEIKKRNCKDNLENIAREKQRLLLMERQQNTIFVSLDGALVELKKLLKNDKKE